MLNILVNNPFRVLGVYSNAKPADIVSNCDDLDAYLAIGQSVSFDLDYNNILPVVNRTQEIVNQAKSKINLPKDKLKHALFWFIKDSSSTHAMNYLKNGDFNNADSVFDIEDSFATRINKAVTALMQNNVGSAIAYVTEMIHDFDEQGFRDDFVKAICGDTYSIGENELAQLFIDTLLEENSASGLRDLFQKHGVSQDDDDYLTEKAVDVPISRINTEIAKAKAVNRNDANANYQAGKALMENTRPDLDEAKKLLGASDLRYQMLADDLAKTILQCGINYFNNKKEESKETIDKALSLGEYALQIVIGDLEKSHIQHNLGILHKKKADLPPQEVETETIAILYALREFIDLPDKIEHSVNLLNTTKPYFLGIKAKLGGTNPFYLKLSTQVVNNALHNIIEEVNEVQKAPSYNLGSSPAAQAAMQKILESSKFTRMVRIVQTVSKAWNCTKIMDTFDMEPDFKKDRYEPNRKILEDMRKQFSQLSDPLPPFNTTPTSIPPSGNDDNKNWGCIIVGIVAFIIFIIMVTQ